MNRWVKLILGYYYEQPKINRISFREDVLGLGWEGRRGSRIDIQNLESVIVIKPNPH